MSIQALKYFNCQSANTVCEQMSRALTSRTLVAEKEPSPAHCFIPFPHAQTRNSLLDHGPPWVHLSVPWLPLPHILTDLDCQNLSQAPMDLCSLLFDRLLLSVIL